VSDQKLPGSNTPQGFIGGADTTWVGAMTRRCVTDFTFIDKRAQPKSRHLRRLLLGDKARVGTAKPGQQGHRSRVERTRGQGMQTHGHESLSLWEPARCAREARHHPWGLRDVN
jgi:hypothetical protein